MAEIEILPQKIVDRRIVILKSRIDSRTVKFQGEKLKTGFFVRFGFLKPKPKEVQLIAFSKYYEPYIVIGGKYSIDYCKRHGYALKVEDRTQALFIGGKKLKPEPLSVEGNARVIKLVGEEHSHYQKESYMVLDRMLQEVSPENLFFAPSERDLEIQDVNFDLRRPQISLDEEIAFLRSKIARRPADVAEIIKEIFEINERTIIYNPIYELTYKNVKTGKRVTMLINGVSGGVVVGKFDKASLKLGDYLSASPENLVTMQTRFFQAEPDQPLIRNDAYGVNSTNRNLAENLEAKEKMNTISPSTPQPIAPPLSSFRFDAENTTRVVTDFMARLGYTQGKFPTKMDLDGETNVVEIQLQEGVAKISSLLKKNRKKDNDVITITALDGEEQLNEKFEAEQERKKKRLF
jgi:hypothetical protein